MFRARMAVLLLSAGLSGCVCLPPPGGGGYFGFSPFTGAAGAPPCNCGPAVGAPPCNCGNPPLPVEGGPVLDTNGLAPQPGMPALVSPPRLRPQPLAQPIPAPP